MLLTLARAAYKARLASATAVWTAIGRATLRLLGRACLGRGIRIRGPIRVRVFPGGRVTIGNGVRFQSGFPYNPVGSECVMSLWVGPAGHLEIGAGAGLSGASLVCLESLTIGPRTLIGGGVRIYDTDFHALTPEGRQPGSPQEVRTAPVRIGADCFVGGYSIILKGVTIGDGAVIGAGSVVTRDVPPRQIWAGNPARFIRSLDEMPTDGSHPGGRDA